MTSPRTSRGEGVALALGLVLALCPATSAAASMSDCPEGSLAPPTLPDGTVGEPYSEQFSVQGSTREYSFAVSAGYLPPGLSLGSDGLLAGTPEEPHQSLYTFTVTAADRSTCGISASYDLVIHPAPMDFVSGAGLGEPNANRVRLHDGAGKPLPVDFHAYGAGRWGSNVAEGDIDGGGRDELLTGPGPGPALAPLVLAFRRDASALAKVRFYAYATLRFGVNVSSAALDGDRYDEIVTGAGPGALFGPQVRGWDFDATRLLPAPGVNFYAYATLRYGVNVTRAPEPQGGTDGIVTGPGPGPVFAPLVRDFRENGDERPSFWAFGVLQYGANVAGGDIDGGGEGDIAAAQGPGPGPAFTSRLRGFRCDGVQLSELPGYDVLPFPTHYGARVGLGDFDADGRCELLAGAGRDPVADSTTKSYRYDGSVLALRAGSFLPFPGDAYGVNVASARCGY